MDYNERKSMDYNEKKSIDYNEKKSMDYNERCFHSSILLLVTKYYIHRSYFFQESEG